MSGIDVFSWIVLITLLLAFVVGFIVLAKLPGDLAKKRGHPQAEAINAAGWLGLLLTLGVVWVLAMVWALTKPLATAATAAPAVGSGSGGADDTQPHERLETAEGTTA